MKHNKISTGTLVALGLSIQSLYAVAETGTDNITEVKDHSHISHNHSHEAKDKIAEGMCGSGMRMDLDGMVMHENIDNLPKDCKQISEEISIQVKAGVKYSEPYPGTVFGLDSHSWHAKPCARITIEFKNEDEIRHQWMLHGLPRYLYPGGMFHIEANGLTTKTGTFIVPSSHYTYLVHCDIAQHMEKGMKAQFVIGKGRKDLSSIPGLTEAKFADSYPNKSSTAVSTFRSENIE
ncbi:MAG: multicopper oxidase domain-containing protein [Methylococcales symbiont of Hymedesmia sp. n. MRB-2018]|nr:MAG: multicopper oxidase domain-containing protein [Methylococcales symbiont of Hymedesmia sp. n. MRB-2018]